MDIEEPLTPLEKEWGQRLRAQPETPCLEAEELMALADLADLTQAPASLQPAMTHALLCPICRTRVMDLRDIEGQPAPAPEPTAGRPTAGEWLARWRSLLGRPGEEKAGDTAASRHTRLWPAAPAFAGALALMAGILAIRSNQLTAALREARQQSRKAEQALALSANVAAASRQEAMQYKTELRQTETRLSQSQAAYRQVKRQFDAASLFAISQTAPPADRADFEKALQSQRAELPDYARAAPSGEQAEVLGGVAREINLVRPVSTAVLDPTPLFVWKPVRGAVRYRIAVGRGKAEAGSFLEVEAQGTAWQPLPGQLQPDTSYQWQVTAFDTNGARLALSPSAAFRVLSPAARTRLEAARSRYGSRPFLLGVVYARAGLRDEAESQFELLTRAAGSQEERDRAARLLRSVQVPPPDHSSR
jgi:hypothetical protein